LGNDTGGGSIKGIKRTSGKRNKLYSIWFPFQSSRGISCWGIWGGERMKGGKKRKKKRTYALDTAGTDERGGINGARRKLGHDYFLTTRKKTKLRRGREEGKKKEGEERKEVC